MQMTCPKCNGQMRTYERSGITVDQCTECRGIFLDRGELERLVDVENSVHGGRPQQPAGSAPPPPPPPGYGQPPAHGYGQPAAPGYGQPHVPPPPPAPYGGYPPAPAHGGGYPAHTSYGYGHGHHRNRRHKTVFESLFDD